ncbi:MAG: hypothetical protein JXA98_02130 [Methanosarcinaceae archaeon]|nr:hypothetical protein [Methanosarcinaceae archaeon]
MDSDNDAKIKKISRLLELGGTMLADHCNACGSPMFRYHGQVLCPVCNSEERAQPVQPIKTTPHVPEPKPGPTPTQPITKATSVVSDEIVSLENLILIKITGIAQLMQDENDTRRILEYFEMIERGLDVIERLKKNV